MKIRLSKQNTMSSSEENSFWDSKHLQIIRGIPFDTAFKRNYIEDSMDYVPRDGDIFIASYPKTGTTWMSYIVQQIITRGESFPNFSNMLKNVIPFLEMTGIGVVETLTTDPRVYKHHLPYDKVRKNPRSKYIYIYRNPEDTFVSYYHFMKNIYVVTDFDEFFEDFLKGDLSSGSYFDHVLSYLREQSEENLLLVSYEKLHAARKEMVLKIAQFLGENYYQDLLTNAEVLEKIIEHTSFDYMKKTLRAAEDPKDVPKHQVHFFRKGTVGDGKKSLNDDQLKRLTKLVLEKMAGTEVIKEWLTT